MDTATLVLIPILVEYAGLDTAVMGIGPALVVVDSGRPVRVANTIKRGFETSVDK